MELLRRIGSLGLIGLLFAAVVPPASAQEEDDDFSRGSLGLLRVTGPDSRSFLQDLRLARQAIGEERYDDALSYLGRLLTADPSKATDDNPVMLEDYFLVKGDGDLLTSIKTEALRLLDSIPSKALKQYELAHGAEAQALLDEGFASGDADKLAEVMRRFFHTQAGYRACLALGRLNLEQGRPLSAASYLKRLVATPAAQSATEPEASILLAGALLHAGQAKQATEVLLALKHRQPTFALRGIASPAFASDEEALPWLEKLFGRLQSRDAPTALQWTMFRGNAERNAITSFAEPTSTPRWRVPIANDPGDEQLIAEASRSLQQQGIPSLPSMHALAVRNVVIMRGPDQLVAVNVVSGKRIWVYPGQDSATKRESRRLAVPSGPQTRIAQLKQRVWDDAPLGQVASDGELVYFVDGLGDAAPYGSPSFTINRFGRDRNVDAQPPFNKLVAISLKKEGSLIWESPNKGDDDPLHQAFFLGAPLAINGQVYAIAEIKGEITLAALDAATGELGWKQQIGHVESFNVLGDPLRRMAGASPSYADGVLVCPTNAGAVVAIDVATRRLLWGSEYSHDHNRFSRFDGARFRPYGDRWVDGTATIAEGKVILTPPDSNDLHCLDLTTGKPVWPAKRREDLLFVAGVHEGTIVLVGKSQIVGIKLADGQPAWDDIAIDLPSGRGVLDKSHYYQPTVSGKLLVVDLASGEVQQSFTTTKPLGNLTTYQDDIISLTDECLAAYPRTDRLEQKITDALASDPRDPWALARRGELLMHKRNWTEALAMLRQAIAQPKPDPAAAGMLAETILALLEEDYAKYVDLSAEAEKLVIDDPQLSNRYHRIVAMGREKQGDRIGAFRAFLGVDAGNHSAEDSTLAREKLIDLDLRWQARSNRWIASHLASLYRDASDAERREMDQAVAAQFSGVPKNTPGALREFVERFTFHPLAGEGQLDLAKLLLASGNLLEAEILVDQQASASDRRLAGQAMALSAQIMRQAGRWPEALGRYQKVGTEFADLEVEPKTTGRQLLDSVGKQYDYRQALAAASKTFARGRAVVELDTRSSMRSTTDQRRAFPVTLLQADSGQDAPPLVTLEPMPGAENRLRIRNGQGRDIATISLTRSESRRLFAGPGLPPMGRLAGHLLIVSTGHEVLAIDLLRGSRDPSDVILWRQDLIDATDSNQYTMYSQKGVANPWATVRFFPADTNNRPLGIVSPITSAGLCFIKQKQLYCVDPATGQTQWLRSDQEPGADLFGDDEYLFVSPHNSDSAEVYHMLDGSPAGSRKLADFEHRWATNGRRVLSWSQDGKGLHLRLDDVWAEENVWTETAPSGSRAWLCSPDEVAIFCIDGNLKVRSLKDATSKLQTQLDEEKDLQQLYVLKSSTQYLVAIAVRPTNPLPNVNIQPAPPSGNQSPVFTGKIYAFDAATGKGSWPAPAAVSQMSLPLDQPLDQPVLLLLRNIIPRSGQASQKLAYGMLCLDKRSGAVLHEETDASGSISSYDLEAERDASAVRVTVPGKSLRIRFTEEAAPPEPPVQNDQAFAVRPKSGGIFGLFKRAGENAFKSQTNPLEPDFEFSDP
jgi:outer membrane protein assembly factor BamB/tetratricopeptide (TPR) repeat protein